MVTFGKLQWRGNRKKGKYISELGPATVTTLKNAESGSRQGRVDLIDAAREEFKGRLGPTDKAEELIQLFEDFVDNKYGRSAMDTALDMVMLVLPPETDREATRRLFYRVGKTQVADSDGADSSVSSHSAGTTLDVETTKKAIASRIREIFDFYERRDIDPNADRDAMKRTASRCIISIALEALSENAVFYGCPDPPTKIEGAKQLRDLLMEVPNSLEKEDIGDALGLIANLLELA